MININDLIKYQLKDLHELNMYDYETIPIFKCFGFAIFLQDL